MTEPAPNEYGRVLECLGGPPGYEQPRNVLDLHRWLLQGLPGTAIDRLGARYGYGNGDIYAAYQYVDVGAGTFLSELDETLQDEQDRDETYNEVILGANYSISDAMYVWSEVAFYDREFDESDGVGVGVTYLF